MRISALLSSFFSNEFFLYHHLGMGDHLLCNAWVRAEAARHRSAVLFSKKHNLTSVSFMLRDCANIRYLSVENDAQVRDFLKKICPCRVRALGYYGKGWDEGSKESFDRVFYRQGGLSFEKRWDAFKVSRDFRIENALFERLRLSEGRYIFIHDDPGRGYRIDASRIGSRLPIVVPDRRLTGNIFDWCSVLEQAAEIHCMDSAFRILADSIPTKGALYFHWYVRKADAFNTPETRKPWIRMD
jgi:hypothetical protein